MSLVRKAYANLPPALQNLVAGVRGHQLSWWRYGKDTERLVEDALDRESWSVDQWNQWREERLAFILERARTTVPYYKEYWDARGDSDDWKSLSNWPLLEKSELRNSSESFVASDVQKFLMYRDHTGGTTGTAQNIWLRRETIHRQYALFEARVRRWNGLSLNDRWGMLGGQLVVPYSRKKPPFWVWNSGMNQLYLSPYHLSNDLMGFYVEAISKYGLKYLLGYPSALNTLARWIIDNRKQQDVSLEAVITNSEPLYDYQKENIASAFNCRVIESYGMGEAVAAASECSEGVMHLWPEYGIVEEIDGELICTGLLNEDMPLIRYRVGDRGELSDERCGCGRTLPILKNIEGRTDDILIAADGKEVGTIGPVFSKNLPVLEAQVIQGKDRSVHVRYVALSNSVSDIEKELGNRLRERLGDIEIEFEQVDAIPRTSNGKFRAVISERLTS